MQKSYTYTFSVVLKAENYDASQMQLREYLSRNALVGSWLSNPGAWKVELEEEDQLDALEQEEDGDEEDRIYEDEDE